MKIDLVYTKFLDVNASSTTMTVTERGEMERSTTTLQLNMVRVFDKMLTEQGLDLIDLRQT